MARIVVSCAPAGSPSPRNRLASFRGRAAKRGPGPPRHTVTAPISTSLRNKSGYIPDLFTIAMGGGTISRFGIMAVLTLPGVAFVTTKQEMQQAQLWGRARLSSGDEQKDRDTLLAQLSNLIARADGSATTRGEPQMLSRLARQMQDSGMDLAAWLIPQPVRAGLPVAQLQEAPPLRSGVAVGL